MIIYLVGARGSGKTTVASHLGELLQWDVLDLDHVFCQTHNCSIDELVKKSGWDKFRQLEAEVLKDATKSLSGKNAIVATGGGIILKAENRDFMRENGRVFWLKTDPETLAARLATNPLADQRPPLTEMDPEAEIRAILTSREPFYAQCAHHTLDGACTPESICGELMAWLKNNGENGGQG